MNILEQNNSSWRVTDRLTLWKSEGPMLTDEILESVKELALEILSEDNPELKLPKEQRFAARARGFKRRYSDRLRKGIAETLALIGARPEALTTCSNDKGKFVVAEVVRQLLSNANSGRWASLNDVLPLLAEASPDVFLGCASSLCGSSSQPFSALFSEEVGGITGRTYSTGLLWALESLAWNQDYLVRVCTILASLAACDPGGSYSNRPENSLVAILLPWIPHTCADSETRHSAMRCVIRNQPDIAWKTLVKLLPRHHSASSPTCRPEFQAFVPEGWKEGASHPQRMQDEGFYADCALQLAGFRPERLIELLPFYFFINPAFSTFMVDFRERLQSSEILGLPEEQRFAIWTAVVNKTTNHRKYADSAAWCVPEEMLQELEGVADLLKPQDPEVKHKRLFSNREIDLYDEKGNWSDQQQRLMGKRIVALKEILQGGGTDALLRFLRSVEFPREVGSACGSDEALAIDAAFLPALLETGEHSDLVFATAYLFRRFHLEGWNWVASLGITTWSNISKAQFFAHLPSRKDVWLRAEAELGVEYREYWKRAVMHADRDHLEGFEYALGRLVEVGRSDVAIDCLWLGELRSDVYAEVALKAVESLDISKNRIDVYAIQEVFRYLQAMDRVDVDRLALQEWRFLEILDRHSSARPMSLYRQLANVPSFFCEIIQTVYLSRNDQIEGHGGDEQNRREIDDSEGMLARNAYRLLRDWDLPPGTVANGGFEADHLRTWVAEVKARCSESGHWEVASHQIGEVLFYAPRDENGLWPISVCELFDAGEDGGFLEGLEIRIRNSRGVFGFTQGHEENELADKWESVAKSAERGGFARLGAGLRMLAARYRDEGRRSVSEHS